MSQENVEIVLEVMDLFNRPQGPDRDAELLARVVPDVVIDMTRRVFNPDTYEGHDGLRRLQGDVASVWQEFRIDPERVIDAGDRVVVIETRHGRGIGSDVEVTQRSGVIWTLRDGLISRMEADLDPEEALESAGLEEPG
jgi:ketosteroid isomerase-like protein